MKIKPLFDWILIERVVPVDRTAGGIIIPDSAIKHPAEGIVIDAGPGKYKRKKGTGKARFHTTTLKAGQRVFFTEYMTKEIEIDGREIIFIREEDVHGIIEEKTEIAVKGHFPVESKKDNKVLVRNKSELVPKAASSPGSLRDTDTPSGARGKRSLRKKSGADDRPGTSNATRGVKDQKGRKGKKKVSVKK